jgi:hypothetical protein
LHEDTFIAASGVLIASSEKEPLSNVSRKHFSLSSTVIYLCSTASDQILGQSSITKASSTDLATSVFVLAIALQT